MEKMFLAVAGRKPDKSIPNGHVRLNRLKNEFCRLEGIQVFFNFFDSIFSKIFVIENCFRINWERGFSGVFPFWKFMNQINYFAYGKRWNSRVCFLQGFFFAS